MLKKEQQRLLALAEKTALLAGEQLNKQKTQWAEIEQDVGREMKIKADRFVEALILDSLKTTTYPILSEEKGWDQGMSEEGYLWVVDPLDGSFNYYHDIPICAVSIALYRGQHPILSVVYDFNRHELFSALVEEGAWLNKKEIAISTIQTSDKGVLYTGFPTAQDFSDAYSVRLMRFARQWRKVRMIGSAAIALAYVACGRAEYYYERNTRFWDVAAGLALVVAAGGQVQFFGDSVIAPQDVHAHNGLVLFSRL